MLTQKMRRRLDIILADDGSPNALAAIRLVRELPISRAALPKSTITILEVIDPNLGSYDAPLRRAHLAQVEDILSPMGLNLQTHLVSGSPAETILEFAAQKKPDLIIAGARGRRSGLDALLGSVARHVAETAPFPVMIVRPDHPSIRHILFVTDGSENSLHATRYLARFPIPARTRVTVMFVLPARDETRLETWPWPEKPPGYLSTPTIIQVEDELWQSDETEGTAILERACSILAEERLRPLPVLLRGNPAQEILDYASRYQVDLTIAGGRGADQPERWLLGNVTRRLIHESSSSVMIVRSSPRI